MLSEDGNRVLNIWFLPHHTEMLVTYKKLGDEDCTVALSHHLTIVAALHDILQYLCTHSQLGSAQARLGSRANRQLTADWGGINGIGQSRAAWLSSLVRSTLRQSRPNKAGLKCPSMRRSVLPSIRPQKVSLIPIKFGL